MAKLINGLAIAKEIRQELKQHITEWKDEGHRPPHLTAILIGDDPASHTYVNNKIKVRFIIIFYIIFVLISHVLLVIFICMQIYRIDILIHIYILFRLRLKWESQVKRNVFRRQ